MSGGNHTGQRGQAQEQCSQVNLGFHCCRVGAVRGKPAGIEIQNCRPSLEGVGRRLHGPGKWTRTNGKAKDDTDTI